MSEIILDSVIDSIKLLPFLFLTYLFMEWMEHKTGAAARKRIRTAGKFGPVWGGLLGVIPQCGFSAAASSLFAGRVITVGTLIAVYLSTSDEMFPIMISNAVPVVTIVKILTCKAVIGILSGLVLEYVYTHILKKQEPDVDIHEICEEERCHCEHGVISGSYYRSRGDDGGTSCKCRSWASDSVSFEQRQGSESENCGSTLWTWRILGNYY